MLKHTDPRVKLLALLLLSAAALYFSRPQALALLVLASLLLALVLGANLFVFARRFGGLLALLALVALAQAVFFRQGQPLLYVGDMALLYEQGLWRGLAAAMRFVVLLLSMAIMAAEKPRRVIQGLVQLGLPYVFVFMLATALRFLPLFAESFHDALIAIQLRGLVLQELNLPRKLKLYSHLLLPVVADAIIKAQELACAMELRGFGAYPTRTSLFRLEWRGRDSALMILLLFLFVYALFLY
ncbi:MAG: energy-coupling factor transporter transmembrane protein EcfT [Clostridiales bacterium]|nr:energy-coupling factor transporter transmembrane protein EcfT [Clostridiales bacterium]